MPLVSVIVPTYNSARYVRQAIDSALDQDYPNKEIIVIDDGSTDETPQILESYGDRLLVLSQDNAGAAAARNSGLRAAGGEYLAFLDSDDLWLPTKLSKQVAHMRARPEVGLVYCDWAVWRPDKRGEFAPPPIPEPPTGDSDVDPDQSGWLYNKLFKGCIVHTTTAMIRRSVALEVGEFDTSLRRGQDYDYWFRVSRVTRIDKLKAVLSVYRLHDESITNKPFPTNYGYVVITRALNRWGRTGPDGEETPKSVVNHVLARVSFGYGFTHYTVGDPRLARDAFWQCIRHRPFWLSGWINWVRSWLKIVGNRPDGA